MENGYAAPTAVHNERVFPVSTPEAPKGKESNWIQTVPGKGWVTILRLYSPMEAYFDKSWQAGEIELVK